MAPSGGSCASHRAAASRVLRSHSSHPLLASTSSPLRPLPHVTTTTTISIRSVSTSQPLKDASATTSGASGSSSSSSDPSLGPEIKYRPRWSYTPPAMKGPFNPKRPVVPSRSIWHVNSDILLLDAMYEKLLGKEGPNMLREETKWLAVTHKSFDQGRRGFNERLAYTGKMAIVMEITSEIVTSAPPHYSTPEVSKYKFQHPAVEKLDNLNHRQPFDILNRHKMARLAYGVGLDAVVRWKPLMPENLHKSGILLVLNKALHAIAGAIELECGAKVAGRVIRERILRKILS